MVEFDWAFPPGDGTHIEEAVSFWPTQVVPYGSSNQVMVAGKRDSGNTVIELWKIAVPPAPAPYYDINTGAVVYPPYSPRIGKRTVIYDRGLVGKDIVYNMFPNLGTSGVFFVQFWDSRDLYELETSTGALTLLYTASGGTSNVPALSTDWNAKTYGEHATHGYVYCMQRFNGPPDSPLVFFDSDKDGELDSWQHLGADEWDTMDFGLRQHWVSINGDDG